MAPVNKPNLARAGTMELTANEGINYLKSAQKHTLLKFQGLVEDKPAVKRDNTMESTAKEAGILFQGDRPDADAQTRGQQKRLTELKDDSSLEPPSKKVKLSKDTTMAVTAKESKALLAGKKFGNTRGATTKYRKRKNLRKSTSISRTLEEARYVVPGNPKVSEGRKTRSQSLVSPRFAMKRLGTMQTTVSDGKSFMRMTPIFS